MSPGAIEPTCSPRRIGTRRRKVPSSEGKAFVSYPPAGRRGLPGPPEAPRAGRRRMDHPGPAIAPGHGRSEQVRDMGWKVIDGNRYYYRCLSHGRTLYCGGGEVGAAVERHYARARAERERERREEQRRRDEDARLDRALDRLAESAGRAAESTLNTVGFHRHHRGEWRRHGK